MSVESEVPLSFKMAFDTTIFTLEDASAAKGRIFSHLFIARVQNNPEAIEYYSKRYRYVEHWIAERAGTS